MILAATLHTSCVGVIYHGAHHGELKSPCAKMPGSLNPGGPYSWNQVATSTGVRGEWGAPDMVEPLPNGAEKWTYYGATRWSGVTLLAVLLPIPLFLPVGRERVSIDFLDGTAVAGESVKSQELWHAVVGFYGHSGFVAEFERAHPTGVEDVRLKRRTSNADR